MNIIGQQFIKGERVGSSKNPFRSYDAVTGDALPCHFFPATEAEVAAASQAAADAHHEYRKRTLSERATFLETIANNLDSLDDEFVQTVMRETGLPEVRIRGERTRTSEQLRLFATVVMRGDFLGARIDTALPDRQPLPRPDVRQYRIGIGPVAVFGASNFPLAFSVAGGDTASALAAGCSVVVKAHPGHPATSELVAQAIAAAVKQCNMPAGVFNMVFGDKIGAALVRVPEIKAVGFTGSHATGRILCDIAAARPEPIPVFAEMSSVNPVILMPGALAERGSQIARELADSVNLGGGQFCTKPGLVIGFKGEAFDIFCEQFIAAMDGRDPVVMLHGGILKNYLESIQRLQMVDGVELLVGVAAIKNRAQCCVFKADANLLASPTKPLEEEIFGPCTTLVALDDLQQLLALIPVLRGHLTATLISTDSERESCQQLIALLDTRVGRLILNGYPTGVEVCDAMVHSGPYPATSDSRSSSVGTLAIDRFLRPVCYQGYPDQMLPEALQDSNPFGLRRLVDGEWSSKAIL